MCLLGVITSPDLSVIISTKQSIKPTYPIVNPYKIKDTSKTVINSEKKYLFCDKILKVRVERRKNTLEE